MARIRSHHQGPGDPPPRSSGRKRRASSLASTQISTKSIESSRGAPNEGRSASPDNDNGVQSSPKKRVKRAAVDDHEQLTQELQDAVNNTQDSIESPTRDNVQVVINAKPQKRTRFSEPPPVTELETTTPDDTPPRPASQAPTGLTPHLERIGAFQPSKSGRHARFSLPATLDSGEVGAASGSREVREIQFTPLRAVLDTRMKRRLRRSHLSEEVNDIEAHKKDDAKDKKELRELRRLVKEKDEKEQQLMLDLELQRQMGIHIHDDEKITQLEAELNDVRLELTELKAQSIFSGSERAVSEDRTSDFDIDHAVDFNDADPPEFVDPDDINVSQEDMRPVPHTNGFYSSQSSFSLSRITNSQSLSEQASQVKLPNSAHEADIRNFEEALGNIRRELADARSTLDIFNIELQGLGFADDHAASQIILESIRTSFREARLQLEVLLPGQTPVDLQNGDLLKALTDHIYGLMGELTVKTELAENHNQIERVLQTQNSGLLNKLADFQAQNEVLQQEKVDMTAQNAKNVSELEDELQTAHSTLNLREKNVSDQEIKINALEDEVEDMSLDKQRLLDAWNASREEVSKLEAFVLSTQQDFEQAIEQMQLQHANTVQDLETHLADETQAREEADAQLDEKRQFIDSLEEKINSAEAHLENLRDEFARVQISSDAEKAGREAAETLVVQQATFINTLESKIERAEESLKQLQSELEQLRTLAEAEHNQREAAEQDLDDRNTRISELETKLHDEGIQANELRQKLFINQKTTEERISELEEDKKVRDEYYKDVMNTESDRANEAENESAKRNVVIAELELQVAQKEEAAELMKTEYDDLINARDETIERLTENLKELNDDYATLTKNTDFTIASLQLEINGLKDVIKERDSTIAILRDEAIATTETNQNIIAQQDAEISTLTTNLDSARMEIDQLTQEKASLEKRVEDTANDLIRIKNAHTTEVEGLDTTISSLHAEITNLTAMHQQRANEFEATLFEKTEELEALQLVAADRAVDITKLVAQLEELKEAFRKQQEDSDETIKALQEGMRAAVQQAETLSAAYGDRAGEARKVVDAFKFEGVKVTGAKLDLQRVIEGRVGKVKEKVRVSKKGRKGRRVFDSGIGVEDDDEEEAVSGAVTGEAVNGYY